MRKGLAWYPLWTSGHELAWEANSAYRCARLERKVSPRLFRIWRDLRAPLYEQVRRDPDRFRWISNPGVAESLWAEYVP